MPLSLLVMQIAFVPLPRPAGTGEGCDAHRNASATVDPTASATVDPTASATVGLTVVRWSG
jgi:hypothetical protein